MINGELIVDNFAGGGGTSTGIEEATGCYGGLKCIKMLQIIVEMTRKENRVF